MKNDEILRNELLRLSKLSSLELFRKYMLFRITCPLISIFDYVPNKQLWIHRLEKFGILNTFLDQFTGGSNIDSVVQRAKQILGSQNQIIFDYATESLNTKKDPLQHFDENIGKIPKGNAIALKISTILNGSNISDLEENVFVDRFSKFCKRMKHSGIKIMIDAEESEYQDIIDSIAIKVMPIINTENVFLFNTYQMYKVDTYNTLLSHLEMSEKQNYGMGIKLVRGAYIEHEKRRNPTVLYNTKEQVDENYNRVMQELIKRSINNKRLSTMIATHNVSSVRIACDMLSNISGKDSCDVIFAQLFGMGNAIGNYVVGKGFSNYKYVPYGKTEDLVPYMLRRARENSAFSSMTANEAELYFKAFFNMKG